MTRGTGWTSTGGKEENNEQQESKSAMAQRQNDEVERQQTKQNGGRWIHARLDRAGTQHGSSRLLATRTPTGAQEENEMSQTELDAGRGKLSVHGRQIPEREPGTREEIHQWGGELDSGPKKNHRGERKPGAMSKSKRGTP
jgi:hypothetical protein